MLTSQVAKVVPGTRTVCQNGKSTAPAPCCCLPPKRRQRCCSRRRSYRKRCPRTAGSIFRRVLPRTRQKPGTPVAASPVLHGGWHGPRSGLPPVPPPSAPRHERFLKRSNSRPRCTDPRPRTPARRSPVAMRAPSARFWVETPPPPRCCRHRNS